jgi:hypothetical protein
LGLQRMDVSRGNDAPEGAAVSTGEVTLAED